MMLDTHLTAEDWEFLAELESESEREIALNKTEANLKYASDKITELQEVLNPVNQ